MILWIAGHGESDPGACGNGYKEANVTREMLRMIEDRCADCIVYPTEYNFYRRLKENKQYFIPQGVNRVVEIHLNAFNGKAEGTEVFVHNNESDEMLLESANVFLHGMEEMGYRNRGIKRRSDLQNMNYFYKKGVPYCLIEICFIDRKSDMQRFDVTKEQIADLIVSKFGIYQEPKQLYRVQVGAYANLSNAKDMQKKLKVDGYPAVIV